MGLPVCNKPLHSGLQDTSPHWLAPPANQCASDPALTVYDEEHAVTYMHLADDEGHAVTYMRLLDADEGADCREVARIVLHIDPEREPDRAWQAFESHLARAKWMTRDGYRHLLRRGWPRGDFGELPPS